MLNELKVWLPGLALYAAGAIAPAIVIFLLPR
jgi:hypothetical protein